MDKFLDGFLNDISKVSDLDKHKKALDRLWSNLEIEKYYKYNCELKLSGYKILRNKQGKHIVKLR